MALERRPQDLDEEGVPRRAELKLRDVTGPSLLQHLEGGPLDFRFTLSRPLTRFEYAVWERGQFLGTASVVLGSDKIGVKGDADRFGPLVNDVNRALVAIEAEGRQVEISTRKRHSALEAELDSWRQSLD